MSAFRRLMTGLPPGSRAYSVFSGGGRYFNSAKAKAAEVATKSTTAAAKPKPDSSKDLPSTISASAPKQDGSQPAAGASGEPSANSVAEDLASFQNSTFNAAHPTVTPNDYKLHQFFSLHRPLLLLHNTPAMFTPGPSFESILSPQSHEEQQQQARPISVFEDFPTDSSVDADAVAARQLGRALAMSRIGAAVSWETTLKHLGLDPAKAPERVDMQQQMDKDWEDVQILLDSTKRKKKKKMKKHKLKKRRRATRSERLKLK